MKMNHTLNLNFRSLLPFILAFSLIAEETGRLYENNFERAEVDKVPEDFLVLDGGFVVKQEGHNKFLELPGAPLDTFGALFGPTEKEGAMVSARIQGQSKGRRFPTFAVGLNGVGGYKLQVSPAKKALELYKGDVVKASVPYEWQSSQWTFLRLQVRGVKEGEWRIEGKAWPQDGKQPDWLVRAEEKEPPPPGRAAIWGSPYAGTPIRYDDLVMESTSSRP